MKKEDTRYKYGDTYTHCGGKVIDGNGYLVWCEDCGSNNKKSPPSITIELEEEL